MSGVFKLRPHDLERDDGCEECSAESRAGLVFFLIERPGKATDRVLCARCTAKLYPDFLEAWAYLRMPIGTPQLAESPSRINGAAARLLEEAPEPETAPCPFPVVGSLFQEEAGQLFRVIEVKPIDGGVTLVLRDLDYPQHTRNKEVKE